MKIVSSVNGVPIRLTAERLHHVERRHPEMLNEESKILETVGTPDFVQHGDAGTLIALRLYAKTPLTKKFCSVVYREMSREDGFILTAYFTSQPNLRRRVAWKP